MIEPGEMLQRLTHSLTREAIKLPEQQNVKFALTGPKHHLLKCRSVLFARSANSVHELVHDGPMLFLCEFT